MTDRPPTPVPFRPPPYPYDQVATLGARAAALPGGVVDCSVGTPTDLPPPAAVAALASSGTERGYPSSAGSPAYREAVAAWIAQEFGVTVDPGQVAACVGTKELVAGVAHLLRLADPSRDTVLYPEVSYPSYAMGALLAGARAVAVPSLDGAGGGMDLGAISDEDAGRALVLWVNSPANPSGALSDLDAAAAWGRRHQVPVFSDECYAELTWDGPPRTILSTGSTGVVAVHSLSKRSNLAGIRAGAYVGDPDVVGYLRTVRQHAGLMVPGPVQAAAVAALADHHHVDLQRDRYQERLTVMAAVLEEAGCPTGLPQGGFYLWVPVPARFGGCWEMAEALASDGGLLVSPGDLYGAAGAGHVRVAVVQPVDRLAMVGQRLRRAGWHRAG